MPTRIFAILVQSTPTRNSPRPFACPRWVRSRRESSRLERACAAAIPGWRIVPASGDFYFWTSSGSVTLPASRYDHNSDWIPLLAGPTPGNRGEIQGDWQNSAKPPRNENQPSNNQLAAESAMIATVRFGISGRSPHDDAQLPKARARVLTSRPRQKSVGQRGGIRAAANCRA